MNLKQLIIKAKDIQVNAYAPYSNFRVAAIVILKDGNQVCGVNVENAAFPATICGERTALAQVITLGYQKNDIEALFLITDSKNLGSPCGVCRQFMIEVMPLTAKVFIGNIDSKEEKDFKIVEVAELLPFAFMPESLKSKKENKK